MAVHNPAGGLTAEEKKIVKALLAKKWRNQDIQHLLNSGGRKATVNSARITAVKQTKTIEPASDAEVQDFIARKQLFDPATGLNALDDERLIRAREAMILAVQVFNGPGYKFKTELFAVLANIAWTYLLYRVLRPKEGRHRRCGRTLSASEQDGGATRLSAFIRHQKQSSRNEDHP